MHEIAGVYIYLIIRLLVNDIDTAEMTALTTEHRRSVSIARGLIDNSNS